MLVDNEAGVLARVVGLFSGRGYNIESLTVAEVDPAGAHLAHHHRHLRHAAGDRADRGAAAPPGADPQRHQLDRSQKAGIEREMALIKVAGTGDKRVEALRMADAFRARAVDTTHTSFVFEITGAPGKIDSFIDLMRPLGLVDVSRTGVAAISRGPEAM